MICKHNLRLLLSLCTIVTCILAQNVTLTLQPNGNLDYQSDSRIYGFQFSHNDCVTNVSGGDAAINNFMISESGNTFIALRNYADSSALNGWIPEGSGTLTELSGNITDQCLFAFSIIGVGDEGVVDNLNVTYVVESSNFLMNLVSFLGIFVLLGLAWSFSCNKKNIPFKVIVWGISLQLIFALIILRDDFWSIVGMAILLILITIYQITSIMHGNVTVRDILIKVLFVLTFFAGIIVAAIFGVTGSEIFDGLTNKVTYFLSLSDYGAKFLFGNLADGQYFFPQGGNWPGFGFQFAFKVLPTIIFFGGFMSVLYYLGIMQKVINSMSKFMKWTIGTSGAETLSCSANIFVGQTEAPLLIKPFINKMTISELGTIMVGGFATIAGGVLAGYISMGVPAGHLIAASVMSAPAALVIGKIIFPEKEKSETSGEAELPKIDSGTNVVEAASNGILDGLKLAVNVGAMLIGFIALVAVIDVLLSFFDKVIDGYLIFWIYFWIETYSYDSSSSIFINLHAFFTYFRLDGIFYDYSTSGLSPIAGEFRGIFPGSLQKLFSTLLSPLAFMMGVPWQDAGKVGNLLGIKLSLNEFLAYGQLGDYIANGAFTSQRSKIIATYALCGFANFSSIGIQIGGISALSPKRKADLAKIGLKAMFGGAIASWLTATIAGILL